MDAKTGILIDHRIREEIMKAVQEGAMCWTSSPAGLFNSIKAKQIAEETAERIINIVRHAA